MRGAWDDAAKRATWVGGEGWLASFNEGDSILGHQMVETIAIAMKQGQRTLHRKPGGFP